MKHFCKYDRRLLRALLLRGAAVGLLMVVVLAPMDDAGQAAGLPKARVVVVGDISYAPMEYLGPDGQTRGILVDIWRLWSSKTGVDVEFRLMDWARAIEAVRSGRADVVSGLFVRQGAGLEFCRPFLKIESYLFFATELGGLQSLQDLAGFQVGVVKGDYLEGLLRDQAPLAKLVLAPNFEELVKMAVDGKVKIFACDDPVASFLLAKRGAEKRFRRTNQPIHIDHLCPAVAQGDRQMFDLVEKGFDAITEDEKQRIITDWFGAPLWSRHGWLWLCVGLLGAGALAIIFFAWNRQLRRNVAKATRVLRDKGQELEAIFQAMPDLLFRFDAQNRYMDYQGGRETRPFVSPEVFLGKPPSQVLPPEAARQLETALELARSRREVVGLEYELPMDGLRRYYEAKLAPLGGDEVICVVRDITERKVAEQEQKMAATVFENSIEGIVVADAEGKVRLVNSAFSVITGYGADEVIGRELNVLRAESMDLAQYEDIWGQLAERGQWSGEYWNRRKGGEAYPEWLTVTVIRDSHGRVINYLAIFYDITEIKRSQEQIRYQAYHDALTGLPNRNLFKDRLRQALHHAERHGSKVAVLFIDLDNFKLINDSLGHDFGDLVLRDIAVRLRRCVRDEDTVARIGGDEFIMVLEEVEGEVGADRVARRVLEYFQRPFVIGRHEIRLGASIGVTLYPDDGAEVETLIKNADMAMYRAKEQGKNNFQMFTPAMQAKITMRLELELALRLALEREEFIVHYQPKVDARSGAIKGMEALLRWHRPGHGLVSPGDFISVAEESGLVAPIGLWILRQACRQAAAWLAVDSELRLAVNVSARQLYQPEFVDLVENTLRETGLPPGLLELEVTESAVMHHETASVRALHELASLGVSISIDDFGTGYSSLYYLKHFPIDTLKVDKSFVRDINRDPNDAAIVRTIINLGHSLNMNVVAEGVETAQQLEFLRTLGCDQIQGYYFSRPVSAEDFAGLLTHGLTPGAADAPR